jgi:hypothetical protein
LRPDQVPPPMTPAAISAAPHTPAPAQPVPTQDSVPQPIEIAKPEPIEPAAPQPIATTGIRRAVSIDRPAVEGGDRSAIGGGERPVSGGPATATFRQASVIEQRIPARGGEIPDDYVAPEYRDPGDSNADAPLFAVTPRQPVSIAPQSLTVAREPMAITRQPITLPPSPPLPATTTASAPAAVVPGASAVIAVAPRADESRVTQVLHQYARAYGRLDASAARAVWPSVDERALARAFAGLQSQAVSFDNCNVNVNGATATASCRGRAIYVGKIGSREPRTEMRQWTFALRRDADDAWKIETAQAQRTGYTDR